MLVVTIIAILMGAAIYKLAGNVEIAKHTAVSADVQALGTQLKLYESMNGFFPTTEQGLQALVTPPDTDPKPARWYQLFKEVPKDPWNKEYIYRAPGFKHADSYDLYSAGPNRNDENGAGDDDWGE